MKCKNLWCLMSILVFSPVFAAGNFLFSDEIGVSLRVPEVEVVHPGDTFYFSLVINNPTQEFFLQVPVFCVWWLGNNFDSDQWFYLPPPDGEWQQGDVHYYTIDVPPGETAIEILPPFGWPDSGMPFSRTINFLAQMSDPAFTKTFGAGDYFSFLAYFGQ